MSDLVSIIMPSYNTEKYIEETIQSVLAQTYTDWELLIVDDCSTDGSVDIINKFVEADNRIKLFVNEKNSGAAFSRNCALREAKGKWIAFLDSDDLWMKEKLEKQIAFMVSNGYDFSYTDYEQIDETSMPNGKWITGPKKITKRKMFRYCWVGCLTVMYNAEKVGVIQIDPSVKKNNDYAIWLKVCKFANCYLLNETLAQYRKRSGSISNRSYLKLIKWHYRLYRIDEKKNPVSALFMTVRNLFWGVWKKLRYVTKNSDVKE